LIMAQVGFSFGYGFKPSGCKLYIFGSNPLEWLEFSLCVTLLKSHAKITPKVCRSAGFRPSGPNNVRFGSNLDLLFLKSNRHQNLWNSLVIMILAWLWSNFHEIRRIVGGENHRYRPPTVTTRLAHGVKEHEIASLILVWVKFILPVALQHYASIYACVWLLG